MHGVDLVTVKELLGHKTIITTNRPLAQEQKAQAVAKLSKLMQAERTGAEDQSERFKRVRGGHQCGLTPKLEQKRNFFSEKRSGTWES